MESNNPSLSPSPPGWGPTAICRCGNAAIRIVLAWIFFILPFGFSVYDLADPALRTEGIPKYAFRVHRSLSAAYETWARRRIESGRAANLNIRQIAETEWPMFGSMFYLMATEALQDAWEKDHSVCRDAPNLYAHGAIEAAAALLADPGHAHWVSQHWGDRYLHRENVFYRMLLINGLTSYHRLLGGDRYVSILKDQVETLSRELDQSPFGLLDDYPGQCFPSDVIAAVAAIHRADGLLGTDHSDFVKRSVRAFQGELVDATGLPPYMADSRTGRIGIARGCSSQWATLWAPAIWPEEAKRWYENFENYFWQRRWMTVGFREFTRDTPHSQWLYDVDAGPVAAGFGVAAGAFGVGAARANGRFDHAYPLSAEVIVLSCPLADGSLLGAKLLSHTSQAPYIGETAILFALTRRPAPGVETKTGGSLPGFVYVILCLYLGIGILLMLATIRHLKRYRKRKLRSMPPLAKIQLAIWVILVLSGTVIIMNDHLAWGLLLVLTAQLLPKGGKKASLTDSVPGRRSAVP